MQNNRSVTEGKVIIIRKQGRIWNDPGTTLAKSKGNIARFLRNSTTDLPR